MPPLTRSSRPQKLIILMAATSPWSRYIALELAANGLDVTVAVPNSNRDDDRFRRGIDGLTQDGLAVQAVGGESCLPKSVSIAWDLRMLQKRLRAGHLLTLYGGSFAMAAWLSGIRPYSIYWVGSDVNSVRGVRAVASILPYRSAQLNIANGMNLAVNARRRFGDGNVIPLYHGIDLAYWSPQGEPIRGRVICTRWFEPIYDNVSVVRSFIEADLSASGASLVLTAVGSEMEKCRDLASSYRNQTAISFLEGCYGDDMLFQLRNSEIYVSMSLSDGSSTSLLEAIAVGCFPVVSDIPANQEWREHGCDMELVPVGDTTSLGNRISSLLNDRDRLRDAKKRNRGVVERVGSISQNMAWLATRLKSQHL